jgi:hypothetical protein
VQKVLLETYQKYNIEKDLIQFCISEFNEMASSLNSGLKREHVIMKFLQSFTFREGLDVLELQRKLDVARNKAYA